MAELTSPTGQTIRVPLPPGTDPQALSRGSIVQPTFDKCCQPTGLVVPGVGSGSGFRDELMPRRTTTAPVKHGQRTNLMFNLYKEDIVPLMGYLGVKEIKTYSSYGDGIYLPMTNWIPTVTYTLNQDETLVEDTGVMIPYTSEIKLEQVGLNFSGELFFATAGSFDQTKVYDFNERPEILPENWDIGIVSNVRLNSLYVLDLEADSANYSTGGAISVIYEALQTYHPGCKLYTYRETDNRNLPIERYNELLKTWALNPRNLGYTEYVI